MRTGLLVSVGLFVGVLAAEAAPAVASGASGQVCMGVVVDDGSGGAPSPQGAQVSPGTTDLEALSTVGDTATQNNSGLVCAINGYPANGLQSCTNVAGGQYYYWSYWQGDPYSNTWTYSQVGPSSHAVNQGQTYVEGWRYQNPGPDNASAPKPAITPAAAFAAACPGVTPASPSGNGSNGGAGSGPTAGGGAGGLGSSPGSPAVSPGVAVPTTVPPSSSATTAPSVAPSQGRNTRGTAAGATTATSSPPTSGASGNGDSGSTTTTSGAHKARGRAAAALASSTPHGGSGGAPVLPLVLVAVVIAAIGGLTLYRWRRRPAEE